jgi:SAM-dependent methyltransferase
VLEFLARYDEIVGGKVRRRFPDFPHPLRLRDWELYHVFSRLPAGDRGLRVLDTGAYSTYTALYLDELTDRAVVSDNFRWAARPDYTRLDVITPLAAWRDVLAACAPRVRVEHADLLDLPYPDDSFDYVTCVSTVEHTPDPRRALAEMVRCVRPGGRVLLTTDHTPGGSRYDGFDRFFSLRQLRRLFRGYADRSGWAPPDYDRANWCYGLGRCVLILFVEIEKLAPGGPTRRGSMLGRTVRAVLRRFGAQPLRP